MIYSYNELTKMVDKLRLIDLNNARLNGDIELQKSIEGRIKYLNDIRWPDHQQPGDDLIVNNRLTPIIG